MVTFIVLLLVTIITSTLGDQEIEMVFKGSEIVPDVISIAPTAVLKVKYIKSGKEVKLGNELAPKDVTEIPKVHYEAEPESLYTLVMTDPDAPSRKEPSLREFQHWLVVNIPGDKVSKGETLTDYIGSGPLEETDLHRYVFLLFKQPKELAYDEPILSNTNKHRANFSTAKFAEKYNLGRPIAGNFYEAQYDESVPALHKQLGLA